MLLKNKYIHLFTKVGLLKPKPSVHQGDTNSPGLSTWASCRLHMWTGHDDFSHNTWGLFRDLVFAPIEKKHCALPYWAERLSSKWQLGDFFFPRLASAPLFLLPMPSESRRSHEGCVQQRYLPSSVISGYVRRHQIQLL